MMTQPKVSIVIPVYNGGNYLSRAIDSALNQTYHNIEVIVVNDGSEDCGVTEKIAKSYGNKIRYFTKPNGGVATAVNLGIDQMQGEYFAWLSHDDEYYSNKIERQMQALVESGDPHRIVISAYDIYDVSKGTITPCVTKSSYFLNQMEKGEFPVLHLLLNGVTILIHKSHFEKYGTFNEALPTTQDYDMWFRILHKNRAIYINEPLIKWRYHESQGSKTINQHSKNCDELHMKMIHEMFTRQEEIIDIYGSRYHFLYHMAKLSKMVNFAITYRQTIQYLYHEKEPKDLINSIKKIKRLLLKNHKIIIWGAGRDGRKMLCNLLCRGIGVTHFVDSDVSKEGSVIDGIECVLPNKIDLQKDIIIIAITKYDDVFEQVQNQGAKYVVLQEELNELFDEIPILKKYISKYFGEIN